MRLTSLSSRLREPVNSLTHWLGAALALPVTLGLLLWAQRRGLPGWPFAVFGLSLLGLYLASALYHSLRPSAGAAVWLRKFDHSAIFLLIAGTYTPVVAFGLEGFWRAAVLWIIWGIAGVGVLLKLLTLGLPRWVSTALYVGMGWIALGFLPQLSRTLPAAALVWLGIGGLLYTLGALIYATKRWRPGPAGLRFPRRWGFHEIWHLFVLGGSGAHALMMFNLR